MSDKHQTKKTEEDSRLAVKYDEMAQKVVDFLEKELPHAEYGDLAVLWITKKVAESFIVELSTRYEAERMLDAFCVSLRRTVEHYTKHTLPAETDQIRH